MKRTLLAFITLIGLVGALAAEDIALPPFSPVTPEVKGQGGTVVALDSGYNTLFGNPAAFASERGSLTLLSVNPTANVSLGGLQALPDKIPEIQSKFGSLGSDPSAITDIEKLVGKFLKEGLGAQLNAGMGLTTGGLGLGFAVQGGVLLKEGTTLLGTSVKLDLIEGAVIGYALPIDLDFSKLRLGLSVRPMQRTYGEYSLDDAKDLMAGNIYLANGFGLGFDLGAQADLGELTIGLAVRDVGGTKFAMSRYAAADIAAGATFPSTGGTAITADTYTTAMTITPALSWTPDFGLLGILVQPKLTAEITVPVLSSAPMPSILASSHLGAEVKLLSFLALRAGLNQGYVTMGFGAHLLFLDANLAIYSDELGTLAGQNKKSGIAAEVALRF